jgi:hypothetical protein
MSQSRWELCSSCSVGAFGLRIRIRYAPGGANSIGRSRALRLPQVCEVRGVILVVARRPVVQWLTAYCRGARSLLRRPRGCNRQPLPSRNRSHRTPSRLVPRRRSRSGRVLRSRRRWGVLRRLGKICSRHLGLQYQHVAQVHLDHVLVYDRRAAD